MLGTYRDDLAAGEVTVDDVFIMSPFKNFYLYFEGVTGEEIGGVLTALGARTLRGLNPKVHHYASPSGVLGEVARLPSFAVSSEPLPGTTYDLLCTDHNVERCEEALQQVTGRAIEPKRYYTRGEGLDNSDLWFRFIEERWPCGETK
jgi:hypothetical protein